MLLKMQPAQWIQGRAWGGSVNESPYILSVLGTEPP